MKKIDENLDLIHIHLFCQAIEAVYVQLTSLVNSQFVIINFPDGR